MWFEADTPPQFDNHDFRLTHSSFDPGLPFAREDWPAFRGSEIDFAIIRNDLSGGDWDVVSKVQSANTSSYLSPTKGSEWSEVIEILDDDSVMDEGTIVVTGTRTYRLELYSWYDEGPPSQNYWTYHIEGGDGGRTGEQPADDSAMDIQLTFSRPLTESEAQAFESFLNTIKALTDAIDRLADNATLTLPNGVTVTGAQLKSIWAKTDFFIDDNNPYLNESGRGEANMIDGLQPTISFNVQNLDAYEDPDLPGGMNYLVAHELGHLTQWGHPSVYDERVANDFARALLHGGTLIYLSNPTFGYTSNAPMQFSVPSSTGGGDGGGRTGPGGGGDYIP